MPSQQLQSEIERLRSPEILKLEQVKRYCNWLDDRRKLRTPGRVVGETGIGKTSASLYYAYENRVIKIPSQNPTIPVLYIELTSSACSSSLLFETILEVLKHKATGGKENQLRKRVWDKLRQCKVELLIIDEAHRLQLKALPDVRDLYDKVKVMPILVGTSSRLDTLIGKDEQIAGRFTCYFNFEKLRGNNFRKTVKIWEQDILRLPEPSNLAGNQEIITLLQSKTDGQLRLLDQILRDAAIKALSAGLKKIDLNVFESIEGDYSLVAS